MYKNNFTAQLLKLKKYSKCLSVYHFYNGIQLVASLFSIKCLIFSYMYAKMSSNYD